jgi:nucleotide-binding universal stress UspA family protein
MKKILVPTDFSTCAYKAVEFAVQSAKYLSAEVTLLHSFERTGSLYAGYAGFNKVFNEDLLTEVHNRLAEDKKIIEETEGVKVNTYVAVTPLADAVKTAVAELSIDMVVMGTLGATGFREKLWGSKTAALIGNISVPVMVIPFEYEWKKPGNILLATNHFEKQAGILDALFGMSGIFGARVKMAVMTDVDNDGAATFMEHNRALPNYQEFLKEHYKDQTLAIEHLYGKELETALQEFIDREKIDILVMITYHKGFWKRLLLPGVTKRMSYHTRIPLLAIPAPKEK